MTVIDPICLPVEEVIHGVQVQDPYRWLEDRTLFKTEAWIGGQQRRCADYFSRCEHIDALRSRVRQFLDIEVVDQPSRVAGKYFYRKRSQGQEQASIYVRDLRGEERLLIDPSACGRFGSVGLHRISDDGVLVAFSFKQGGGDSASLHIANVVNGSILGDSVCTGYLRGFIFDSEANGFFYCQDLSEEADHTIRLHQMGDVSVDRTYFRIRKSEGSRLALTADSFHLGAKFIHRLGEQPVVDFWIAERRNPERWRKVIANRPMPFHPALDQGRIFALSYENAPSGKFVELASDGRESRTVIPERREILRQIVMSGERIFTNFQNERSRWIEQWNFAGQELGYISNLGVGTMQLLPNYSAAAENIFYSFESFDQPLSICEYSIIRDETNLWSQRPSAVPLSAITVTQRTYGAADGVSIPVTMAHLENVQGNQDSPALMTTYGGFGVASSPHFSALVLIMMELGCTFILPHIRGGGDLGKNWHEAARRRNRQVAFDDFISAAKWLFDEQLTTPRKLAIFGGSNAGLLVGAAMTQEPTMFRAVLSIAPLLDMVRYESFDQAAKWWQEYGTVKDPADFEAIYRYSPYHHVETETNYPATLFVTGDRDDRCNPAHVRKMAARLQERKAQQSPVVVDYIPERGHSPTMPLSIRVEALTRRLAFLCKELEIPVVFGGQE